MLTNNYFSCSNLNCLFPFTLRLILSFLFFSFLGKFSFSFCNYIFCYIIFILWARAAAEFCAVLRHTLYRLTASNKLDKTVNTVYSHQDPDAIGLVAE